MKKYCLLFTALILLILITACGNQEKAFSKTETVEKENNASLSQKYNIDTIKVGRGKQTTKGLKAYNDFDDDVIEHIGRKYDVKIDYVTMANIQDAVIALGDNRIGVIPSVTNVSNSEVETTYSYLSEPFYYPNGIELDSSTTFRLGIKKGNENLMNFLNDAIVEMQENGTI